MHIHVEGHLTEPQNADKNLNFFLVSQLSWHSGSHHFLNLSHEAVDGIKESLYTHRQFHTYTHKYIELCLNLRSAT